jgi:hypothetical protein
MAAPLASLIRRSLIRMILGGGFAAVFGIGADFALPARDKMATEDADYQDSPRGLQMCSTCSLFDPPTSCKIVEGVVSPNGWCKNFAIAD